MTLEELERQPVGDTRDRRLSQARNALATLAKLGTDDADVQWRDQLTSWRETLCAERLTIKSPIRDPKVMGQKTNLELSIRCIDFGLGVLTDSGYSLVTLRLGALMREAGYEVTGADPARNYVGSMPWFGSLWEVEKRLSDREKRRATAQAQLDDALLDDADRARREAESNARVAELNSRPQRKTRADGSQYDKFPDGRRVEVEAP